MNRVSSIAIALLLPFALTACPPPPPAPGAMVGPTTAGPGAVLRLNEMNDKADRGDWAGIRTMKLPACDGPNDAVCGKAYALRALACRNLAKTATSDRSALLDCAVADGEAALAASAAVQPNQHSAWRRGLAWSLLERRDAETGPALCRDNATLREQADLLRREQPAFADARFLAASARLAGVARCGMVPACAELAEAARLLAPAPSNDDPRWLSLAAAVRVQQTTQSCGDAS